MSLQQTNPLLTMEAFEAVAGPIGEGPHGRICALLHQPHRFCPKQQSDVGGTNEVQILVSYCFLLTLI